MPQEKKVEYLVVDTSAFIKNAALQDIGVNIFTEDNVVKEIKSKRQLKRLVVLPYDLNIKQAFPEDVKIVSEFAKKTGDYASLSATDIKVMALTYRLHVENIGKDSIKAEPETPKIKDLKVEYEEHPPNLAGFYNPKDKPKIFKNQEETTPEVTQISSYDKLKQLMDKLGLPANDNCSDDNSSDDESLDYYDCSEISDNKNINGSCEMKLKNPDEDCKDDLVEKFISLECCQDDSKACAANVQNEDDILVSVEENSDKEDESSYEDDSDDDDDDNGWITADNINKVKKDMVAEVVEDEPAVVACLTMDFAMQNVLKQMGMHVVTLEGKVIKQLRTFILRCYACFKTTSIMTKEFCPHCGLKTLKKVSIALKDNGETQMFINFKKPLSARGKRFSLPTPKGGKHANNPILREDQPMPDQRVSKLARQKNDPLNDDWIAGYSPFVTRDITSKSAMLGIRLGSKNSNVKYWMRKNPNEVRRRSKSKK